jgi:hypothetical protein
VFSGKTEPDGLCDVGIDFDGLAPPKPGEPDTIERGRRVKRAREYVHAAQALDAYVEVSPSKGGLHVGRAKPLPSGIHRDGVEIYTSGRFFTVSTLGAGGDSSADISDLVDRLAAEITQGQANMGVSAQADVHVRQRTGPIKWENLPENVQRAVKQWLENILDGGVQDREKRQRVWAGDLSDYGGDHSSADMGLCSALMHRGLVDDEVDQALRASGLWREKWDAQRGTGTYGTVTLGKARASWQAAQVQPGPGPGPQPPQQPPQPPSGAGGLLPAIPAPWTPPDRARRLEIIVRKGAYDLAAAAGLAAIMAAEAPFYQQNARLIEVCNLPVKLPKGDPTWTPGVRAVSKAACTRRSCSAPTGRNSTPTENGPHSNHQERSSTWFK